MATFVSASSQGQRTHSARTNFLPFLLLSLNTVYVFTLITCDYASLRGGEVAGLHSPESIFVNFRVDVKQEVVSEVLWPPGNSSGKSLVIFIFGLCSNQIPRKE